MFTLRSRSMAAQAALAMTFLLAACPGPSRPPYREPPQVTLSVPEPNLAAVGLPIVLSVSGCDEVASLSVYDGDQLLKNVTYTGTPTSVTLARNEVPYTSGIAAHLALSARAVCSDGRENVSQAQPAKFFPVAEVYPPPQGSLQTVPDFFVVEGKGPTAQFIGCSGNANGTTSLVRVNRQGEILRSNDQAGTPLPFPCDQNAVITDRNNASGKRWLWQPNVGAFAFDANLTITGGTFAKLDYLTVGPDGDAIIWDSGQGADPNQVGRIPHDGSNDPSRTWVATPPGLPLGSPAITSQGVLLPVFIRDTVTSDEAWLAVDRISYTTGVSASVSYLKRIIIAPLDIPTPPPAAFNPDGSIVYFAVQLQVGKSTIIACALPTGSSGCSGSYEAWASGTLDGAVLLTVPYAGGTRLAAIAAQRAWVLNAETGTASSGHVVNRNGQPLLPDGALVIRQVLPGLGADLFLLNGPGFNPGEPATVPLEIVGTDQAELGELFRYQIAGGSIGAGIDEDGALWLRIGPKLVKALPLEDYRAVRP